MFMAAFLLLGVFSSCAKAEVKKAVIEPVAESKKLVVYTSLDKETYEPIIKEFEERTGIWVEVEKASVGEAFDRIKNAHGDFTCDVIFGGGVENYIQYSDLLVAYRSEEHLAVKESACSETDLWTPFSEIPVVLIYNSKLVAKKLAPKSWADALSGNWDASIAFADPYSSDSSEVVLSALTQLSRENDAYILERISNTLSGNLLSSSSLVSDAVSNGKFSIGITMESYALKAIDEGADIAIVYPYEGVILVPDAAAIVVGTRHEKNAEKFIDFLAGRDVQTKIEESFYRHSVRTDLSLEDNESDISYQNFDSKRAAESRDRNLTLWSELTGRGAVYE